MGYERLNLGDTPRIIVNCNGNLDVRGGEYDETRIEANDPVSIEQFEGGVQISTPGNCTVRMPEGGSVDIGEVLGNCRVKSITGAVTGKQVNGSFSVRRVSDLTLDEVYGDARLRDIQGAVIIRSVHGSVTAREVRGPFRIDEVYGDMLGRSLGSRVEIGEVSGSLALRTDFAPETQSRVSANGDVAFRVPVGANVRFDLPAHVDLSLPHDLEAVHEGERCIVTIGSGKASIRVESASSVAIKQSSAYDDEATFTYTFAIGSKMSEHLASISEELEAQFATLEADLASTVSDRVRRQVERRLHNARRQVDAAQRRVEFEVERAADQAARAERGAGFGFAMDFRGSGEPEPTRQPATEEERMMILKMLEEGRIDVEQAEMLLTALESE